MRLEARLAGCALLFGIGSALGAASFLLFNRVGPLFVLGMTFEGASLVAWWLWGRDETEWVSAARWRTVAVVAIAGGVALLALTAALLSVGPLGFDLAVILLGVGAPFLGTGLVVGGTKLLYELRGRRGAVTGGF